MKKMLQFTVSGMVDYMYQYCLLEKMYKLCHKDTLVTCLCIINAHQITRLIMVRKTEIQLIYMCKFLSSNKKAMD